MTHKRAIEGIQRGVDAPTPIRNAHPGVSLIMALSGLRDMSTIERAGRRTAIPADLVLEHQDGILDEAMRAS